MKNAIVINMMTIDLSWKAYYERQSIKSQNTLSMARGQTIVYSVLSQELQQNF